MISTFSWFNPVEHEPEGKLIEDYSLRITPKDKGALDRMPKPIKQRMNQEIRTIIKFYAHMAKFDPTKGEE